MKRLITIDPVTRVEGRAKISIILNDSGNVERAFLNVPELRGFEAFCLGRPAEDMPQITSRICGLSPGAHHIAATKALDDLYKVEPPQTAKTIRELFINLAMFEAHMLHFYFMGGPDFIVGPGASPNLRNILGVMKSQGIETGRKVIAIRKRARDLMAEIGGKAVHPVFGLPGGVAGQVSSDTRERLKAFAKDAIEFSQLSLNTFRKCAFKNRAIADLIFSDIYATKTHYTGIVDKNNHINFYDGKVRVVTPEGKQLSRFNADVYHSFFAEHVEEWTTMKFTYLRKIGWNGFSEGAGSGTLSVGPLARLNVSNGMATPRAHEEYQKIFKRFTERPIHHIMALYEAELIEALYASEMVSKLSASEDLTSPEIRNLNLSTPREGFSVVEAPNGTLIHHYETDTRGVITGVKLLGATEFNSVALCMSIERAAKKLIRQGKVNEGLLNLVEMSLRAYDPCFSCATHNLPGKTPPLIEILGPRGKTVKILTQIKHGRDMIKGQRTREALINQSTKRKNHKKEIYYG